MKHSLLFLFIVSGSLLAQGNWDGLIQKLTDSRAELEVLSKDVDSIQREKRSELDQWTQRKIDLESQVEREKLRQMQLQSKLARLKKRVLIAHHTDPKAQEKLVLWIEQLEQWVPSSIPYLHQERLKSLTTLKKRVSKKHESLEFVLADLWKFIESEFKLARTNEYQIMDIEVAGVTKKCEVARLGLQSMFVISTDKKIYQAVRETGGWSWKDVNSSLEQDSILSLVKNLKNKNNSGYYQLPLDQKQMGASL